MYKDSIVTDITAKDVDIFYENGAPYLHYVGIAFMNNGVEVEVEIPKMDLVLKDINIKREDRYHDDGRTRFLLSAKQNIYVNHDDVWVNIRPVKRRVSLEQLEKELGYKIELTD